MGPPGELTLEMIMIDVFTFIAIETDRQDVFVLQYFLDFFQYGLRRRT